MMIRLPWAEEIRNLSSFGRAFFPPKDEERHKTKQLNGSLRWDCWMVCIVCAFLSLSLLSHPSWATEFVPLET